MRLCNTDLQINCFTFSHLYVVVQLVWIAAFLVSTKFEHFRCQPPGKISYCCFGAPVLCTGALFCTLFLIRKRLRPYRCRSPPSDFDFCHQLKHRNWRKLL
nr:MAG TPA: Macoilin family [Caudoviricetes sp.]